MCSLTTVTAVASQSVETECRLMTCVSVLVTFVNIRARCCLVQGIVVAFVSLLTSTVEPAYSIDTHRVTNTHVHIFTQQTFIYVLLAICA